MGKLPDDDVEILVANAHREIAKQQASLSVHAKCSVVIEVLLRRSTPTQLLEFATSLKGYVQFLFASYYGSHVMQTLVALLGASDATVGVLTTFCGTSPRMGGSKLQLAVAGTRPARMAWGTRLV